MYSNVRKRKPLLLERVIYMMERELLSVAEFCHCYSIGRTSLYREVNAGRLRLRKFGSATRIARADAEAWANSLPFSDGVAA